MKKHTEGRVNRVNPFAQRRRAADLARDAFLRAAAALTEPVSAGVVAFALLEASVGLLRLAECDDDQQSGRARVERRIRDELKRQALQASEGGVEYG